MLNGGILHWLLLASAAFGWLGWLIAIMSYAELRKWAKLCQRTQIAIGHKGRVVMIHPLTEIADWSQRLRKEELGGRVFYRGGKVSVSVLAKAPAKPEVKIEKRT